MELVPRGAVEMLHAAVAKKTAIVRQHRELDEQMESAMRALKAATDADERKRLLLTCDELLAERARLDEAFKDATAMAEAAQKLAHDETTTIDE